MRFTTPHGSVRYRLPWSWSAFDYGFEPVFLVGNRHEILDGHLADRECSAPRRSGAVFRPENEPAAPRPGSRPGPKAARSVAMALG